MTGPATGKAPGAGSARGGAAAQGQDPLALLRSRAYLQVLAAAALIGIPVSAAAYGFVQLFEHLQRWIFLDLPTGLGFHAPPSWWPFPVLAVGGALVGAGLRFLPGEGGHSPADGMVKGVPAVATLPTILVCSVLSLSFGLVLGPEAPLIALGGGVAGILGRPLLRRGDAAGAAAAALSGAFASIGTIFGSPVTAAVFVMEGLGLGGATLTLVLVPGLLAAGIGALVFVGLGQWTGLGAATLALPDLHPFTRPDLVELGWSVLVGVVAGLLGWAIRWAAIHGRALTRHRVLWTTPLVGVAVAGLAVGFGHATGHPASNVLFSGQANLGPLVSTASAWAVGALALLLLCKSLAYSLSLSSFRGGPAFPALLLGVAGGELAGHLPGFGLVPGVAAGMGAMAVAMMRLPLASVLLPSLLLLHEGIGVTPLVIVAVVSAFLVVEQLPLPSGSGGPAAGAPAADAPAVAVP